MYVQHIMNLLFFPFCCQGQTLIAVGLGAAAAGFAGKIQENGSCLLTDLCTVCHFIQFFPHCPTLGK